MEVKTKFGVGDTVYFLSVENTGSSRRTPEVCIAKDRVVSVRIDISPDTELETEKDLDFADEKVFVSYLLFNHSFPVDEEKLFATPQDLAEYVSSLDVKPL